MLKYEFINRNPKGHKTGDCTTRALAGVLGIEWRDALSEQFSVALHYYYDITDKRVLEKVLAAHGYKKMKQPRKPDNTKYMVKELDQILTKKQLKEGVFVRVANHDTCIKDNKIQDIWDCGNKSVGNYWVYDPEALV